MVPQTLKIILPPMVNQVVALIKNTSCMLLVGGAVDLISTTNAYAVGASTAKNAAAAYVFSGLIFFALCFPLSMIASYWERKLKNRDQHSGIREKKTPDMVSDQELDEIIRASVQTESSFDASAQPKGDDQ
ncbi:hypothetical protein SDC9_194638 [bioreactor metagenome]|uniref:ABC transmembrane type-1 domain-containing protein n=1 Tax=bioreactor metagenome TaxID=1076179 RepID=A0A645I704_9ZZZZ